VSTASPIELIDIEGRKIVADIISKQGDDIKIRKADNKEYTISIAKLTKKTQNLIDLEMKTIANSKWRV
jgi:predicted thioesterase